MLAALGARDGGWGGLAVVHFGGDGLACPGGKNPGEEVDDVSGALADLGGVEDDVVVVEVEDHGDVEFLAQGQEFVDGPADVVVFEHEALLHVGGERGVVLAKAV